MKINFVLLWSTLGGGTKIILRLANELSLRGHEVSLITLGTKRDLDWIDFRGQVIRIPIPWGERLIRKYNSLFHQKPDFRKRFYINAINVISEKIPECDINVATYGITAFSVFLSGKGKGFYYAQHYEPLTYSDYFFQKLAEVSYLLPLKKITNSTWLRNQISEHLGKDVAHAEVVPSAVDTLIFTTKSSGEFIKRNNAFRVVCMGKVEEWKGFREALDAMSIFFRNHPNDDIEFFVYSFRDNLLKNKGAPYTLVTNIQGERLAELLSTADVVIIPSWYESSPLPGLEAMACGAALVTTQFGVEDFAIDNENALIVPPQNPQFIADAVTRLFEDRVLRDRLISNGLKTAVKFSWDKTVDRIEDIFKHA
ncbi:MAG: glycosyltransferase family 4 protein [Patescibacteria group bacterium]|nr:glycosyltransferase family 4 protein [Patescibacteria group bacterium]